MRTLLNSRLLTPPPPFLTTNFHSSPPPCSLFHYSFRPNKRTHFLAPCSSLKQRKKEPQTLRKTNAPQSLRWFLNPKGDDSDDKIKGDGGEAEEGLEGDTAFKGTLLAGVLLFGAVGGFGAAGYIYKDQINAFLNQFSGFIEVSPFGEEELRDGSKMTEDEANGPVLSYGPAGYALFVAVYAGLEILAIPAIPLTMSAGVLFGSLVGTIIVSISGTVAASIAFLIARYFARERILKLVEGNKKFLAIDKAIGENGFKVVTFFG
uniref:VTT domain-containing protein n=1 Tax=Salix viminalis TaxID=40686 RepID=A0A6N2MBY1_SALVM